MSTLFRRTFVGSNSFLPPINHCICVASIYSARGPKHAAQLFVPKVGKISIHPPFRDPRAVYKDLLHATTFPLKFGDQTAKSILKQRKEKWDRITMNTK